MNRALDQHPFLLSVVLCYCGVDAETIWWIGAGRVGTQWMFVAHQSNGAVTNSPMTYKELGIERTEQREPARVVRRTYEHGLVERALERRHLRCGKAFRL